jgi:hypothetical protein
LAFGWTDEYILTLSSGEVLTKLFEIRRQKIVDTVLKLESYGESGLDVLKEMEEYNPVKRYWLKKCNKVEDKLVPNIEQIESDAKIISEFLKKVDDGTIVRH